VFKTLETRDAGYEVVSADRGLSEPWQVERVELKVEEQDVHVWVEHDAQARFGCPECGKLFPLYDHAAERRWRHMDTCQFETYCMPGFPEWIVRNMACRT